VRAALGLLVLGSLFPSLTGRASTRAFAETYEARTGSEGDAQVETWVDNEDASLTGPNWAVWRVWWGGTAAITDALEVSAYVTGAQQRNGPANSTTSASTNTSDFALEKLLLLGRYRFVGDGLTGFSLMLQLELGIPMMPTRADVLDYGLMDHAYDLAERVVATYDLAHLLIAANVIFAESETAAENAVGYEFETYAKYAVGVAYAPFQPGLHGPPFTVGVEAFGDIPINNQHHGDWSVWAPGGFPFAVGPALSFARGRFWATASFGYAPGGAFALGPTGPVFNSSETIGRLIVAFEL
jgi:hypothetical protein